MPADSSLVHFKPLILLKSAHLQTIWAQQLRQIPSASISTEILKLPNERLIEFFSTPNERHPLPVLLLPGLGGSIDSPYIRGMLATLSQQGYQAFFLRFHSFAHEPQTQTKVGMHAGDTETLDYIINLIAKRTENRPLAVIGFSLGGAVLLNWLAKYGDKSMVQAAVAVSVPFELQIAEARLRRGFSRLYQAYLLNCQKRLVLQTLKQSADPLFRERLKKVRTFSQFDDLVTAPMHGFRDAADYYTRCSPRQILKDIRSPTLLIHAEDDPFMTTDAIPRPSELSPHVRLELSKHGGHVGFVSGLPWKPRYWLEERIPEYLSRFVD